MKRIVALSFTILFLFSLSSCGSSKIRIPKTLKEEIKSQMSDDEINKLNTFVKELITSYNQRSPEVVTVESSFGSHISSETYFIETSDYSNARQELREAAKTNDVLSKAVQLGFIIDMEAAMGSVSPGDDATPEEVMEDIEKNIDSIVQYYYD